MWKYFPKTHDVPGEMQNMYYVLWCSLDKITYKHMPKSLFDWCGGFAKCFVYGFTEQIFSCWVLGTALSMELTFQKGR